MRFFFNYAYRNLLRRKGRTALTLIPVVVGTMLLVYIISFVEGVNDQSISNIIKYKTAHAKIYNDKYRIDKNNDNQKYTFKTDKQLLAYLRNNQYIESFTPSISFSGKLSDGVNKIPVIILGIDGNSYNDVFSTLTDDSLTAPDSGEVYIGRALTSLFSFEKGDICFLEARTKYGAFDALDLVYRENISSGNPELDRNYVFISLNNAKSFFESEGEVTNIAVKLKDRNELEQFRMQAASELKEIRPDLKIITWEEEEEDYFAFAAADRASGYVFIMIILVIAGVGIANTMLLSMYERLDEIGTIRALGSSNKVVMKLFLTEGGIVGLLGGLIGSAVGILIMWHAAAYGIDMSSLVGDMDVGYPISSVVKGSFNLIIVVRTVIFTVFMAVIATLYPAYRANKEEIREIMK